MLVSYVADHWTRQPPPNTPLDYESEICRGLVLAVNGGAHGIDLARGLLTSSSLPARTLRTAGQGHTFNANSMQFGNADGFSLETGFWALSYFRCGSLSAQRGLLSKYTAAGITPFTGFVRTSGEFANYRSTAVNDGTWGTKTPDANIITTGRDFVGSWEVADNFVHTPTDLYVNGRYPTQGWTYGPNGSNTTVNEGGGGFSLHIGASNGGGSQWNGEIFLSLLGVGEKGGEHHLRLHSNPWQIYWRNVRTIFLPLVAGGGVNLAVDSGTLTLTNETLTTRYDVAVEYATIEAVGQTIGVAYVVPVTSGTVELVGQDVAIQIGGNLTLAVDSSNLDLVGQDVVLRLSVAVGEATAELAGQSVGLNYSIPVSHGTVELLGQDVGITLPSGSVTLTVDSGTLQLTGSNILITLTGVIGVEKKFGLYDVDPIFFQATPEIQWAIREFHKIREQFEHGIVKTIPILAVAPEKPYEGMLVGADGTNWDPGSGRGAYEYINGGWAKL